MKSLLSRKVAFSCVSAVAVACTASAHAATITVNSLADDVFPDATGVIFDAAGGAVTLTAAKCTLRMAIAASNINTNVGGALGCPGDSGADTVQFAPALTAGGPATIALNPAKRLPTPLYTNNTSLLVLTGDTTVIGPSNNALSISGGGSRTSGDYRILNINDGGDSTLATVAISNLTFRDARMVAQFDQTTTPTTVRGAGGGCVVAVENITLTNVTFDSCTSQGASEPGVPTNYATGTGGALWVGAASTASTARPNVTLNQVSARNSQAYHSQTAYAVPAVANSFVSTAGCMMLGGRNVGTLALTSVTAENCEADSWGAMAINNALSATINALHVTRSRAIGSRSTTDSNIDGGYVGGVSLRGGASPLGTIVATDVTASYNVANSDRGGVEIRNLSSFTGTGFDVVSNVAAGYTGGLEVRDVQSGTLGDTLIYRNTAAGAFGGFRARLNGSTRTFAFNNMVVVQNVAAGNASLGGGGGGGQFETDGIYQLVNSTIAFNSVGPGYYGSGVQVNMHSTLANGIDVLISNSTIARNDALGSEALGAFTFASSSPTTNGRITVQSSILGNRAVGATQNTVGASAAEAARIFYSNTLVEGPNTGVLNLATVCVGSVICGPDAQLTPLAIANSGLPTGVPVVLLPKSTSPALNAGANPLALSTDVRGLPRANGAIDMGAVESQPGELVAACKLDMDGDNQVLPFKEGLVLLRSMLGLNATATVNGTGITQPQWDATRNNLNANCGTNFAP